MLSLKDGTNVYYIGTDRKISTVEKIRDSIQDRQVIARISSSDESYNSYYETRLSKFDQNGIDIDYFVRVNEIEYMSKFYTEYVITRELKIESQLWIEKYFYRVLVFWHEVINRQNIKVALVKNVRLGYKDNYATKNMNTRDLILYELIVNYKLKVTQRFEWKNGRSSCSNRNIESDDSNITRESGENSRVKVKTVVEVWRVKCRQPIDEYSDGSFLSLKLSDRWLQIKIKEEIEGYLVKNYKRVGL